MLPDSPITETDDSEVWDDFFCSHIGNMPHQVVNDALQQETVFLISAPSTSTLALLDHENDICCDASLQHVLKVVKMMSPEALNASVRDICSVVCMADRVAPSAPLKKSKAAIGDNLVGIISSCLRKRSFSRFEGTNGSRKTKSCRSAWMYAIFRELIVGEYFGLNSASSCTKRPKNEILAVKHAVLEEIRKINEQLIDTVVSICEKDMMTTETAAALERSYGIIVKCSFVAVAFSTNIITQKASTLEFAVHPLKFLVPKSYPHCSPIFKKLHVEACSDYRDVSFRAMEKFNRLVKNLPHPFSVSEVARTWDLCARTVVLEYAEQNGGGSFSSKYGTWEDCVHAAAS